MTIEAATFIQDLVPTNPPGGDSKSQGDDHLRLIKATLKNTFKNADGTVYLPRVISKSANYSPIATDDGTTIYCDTTSASFTLTLPTLTADDIGWTLYIIKISSDNNAVFFAPASGTINGYSKVRRSVAGQLSIITWTGTAWLATRPEGSPVGTVLEFYGTTLPPGHLWADGGAFSGTNYVELASVLGSAVTPDRRGRVAAARDNLGGTAAGRLTGALTGSVSGTTLNAGGGQEGTDLSVAQLPSHGHTFTTAVTNIDHSHSGTTAGEDAAHTHSFSGTTSTESSDHQHLNSNAFTAATGTAVGAGGTFAGTQSAVNTSGVNANHTHSYSGITSGESAGHGHTFTTGVMNSNATHNHTGATDATGSGSNHNNVQPTLVCNAIVVAE